MALVGVQFGKHVGRDLPGTFRPDRDLGRRQEAGEPQQEQQEEYQQIAPFAPFLIILWEAFSGHSPVLCRMLRARLARQRRQDHAERAAGTRCADDADLAAVRLDDGPGYI